MSSAMMSPTPMAANINHLFIEGSTYEAGQIWTAKVSYRELTGSLPYLSTHSPPDNTFSVYLLIYFLEVPLEVLQVYLNWKAAKIIMRYLVGTVGHATLVGKDSKSRIVVSRPIQRNLASVLVTGQRMFN